MTIRRSRKSILLAGAFALATFPAIAADVYTGPGGGYKDGPYVPVATWTGFYIGANGGYAWDARNRPSAQIEDNGGFGGGQIGYNWQGGFGLGRNLVFGIEADFQGADIDHSQLQALRFFQGTHISNHKDTFLHRRSIDDFGTVRGRIGYGFDQTLVYFTGGFAYGNKNNEFDDLGTGNVLKDDGTKTGYVLGGGVEYKINPLWSLKAEYQFVQLGNDNATDGLGDFIRTKDSWLNTVRGGINYHFSSPLEPLK